jgi:ribonuclease D
MQESPTEDPKNFATSIDKQSINALPLAKVEGEVVLIDDAEALCQACNHLRKEQFLGFDTETRPTFRKGENHPTALLQLSGATHTYLFQLLKITDLSPLAPILSDPKILKVGVAIHDDIRKLRETIAFTPGGFIELADITQKARIVNTGLRSLAALLLGVRVSKSSQISNWARADLTPAQITYAATDSWISRRIYERLMELGLTSPNSAQ